MHTPLRHLDRLYRFDHLAPAIHQVPWVTRRGKSTEYSVLVRWSAHCYSRGVTTVKEDDVIVPDRALRVFCPDRHSDSLEAVLMIGAMLTRPTSPVGLTMERNWSTYRLHAMAPGGERFYVFFRLRPLDILDPTSVDLYVESAYRRGHVKTVQTAPFGRAIERMLE